ncbi:hypothetical protein LCGC14_0480760 [marine sediment metagenome]|uniref:Uncharacterized protein n=1 Tax=marine sediment metagenome TaxID=412755 RepID=A0A0F9SSH7_9ZZZZ
MGGKGKKVKKAKRNPIKISHPSANKLRHRKDWARGRR